MPSDKLKSPALFPFAYNQSLQAVVKRFQAIDGAHPVEETFAEDFDHKGVQKEMRKARALLKSLTRHPTHETSLVVASLNYAAEVRCRAVPPDRAGDKWKAVFRVARVERFSDIVVNAPQPGPTMTEAEARDMLLRSVGLKR